MLTFNKESFCLWLLFVLFVCNRLLINQKLKKILQRDKKRSTQSVILNFIFLPCIGRHFLDLGLKNRVSIFIGLLPN